MKTQRDHREDICRIGRLVFEKGWVAANDGNISIRLDDRRVLTTPTGVCKGMMDPEDLIIVDMEGQKLSGRREPTTEMLMHLAIYGLRPDVKAVVHAHPPVATGYASAGRSLNQALLPEVVIAFGCVPLAEYGLPGTPELSEKLLPLIPDHDALLMANHGAVCYAEDVYTAYFRMETVEHFARIALVAELLGGPKVLPRGEVDRLLQSRDRYGAKQANGAGERSCPVAAGEPGSGEERIYVTRAELKGLVDEVLRSRGLT